MTNQEQDETWFIYTLMDHFNCHFISSPVTRQTATDAINLLECTVIFNV